MIQIDNLRMRKYDALNWTIEQKYIAHHGIHTGETNWKNIGYYESLETATRNLFIISISDTDSISDLIKAIDKAKEAIIKALLPR